MILIPIGILLWAAFGWKVFGAILIIIGLLDFAAWANGR